MFKIEQAARAAKEIAVTFDKSNYYCLVEIFHNSFFYSQGLQGSSSPLKNNPDSPHQDKKIIPSKITIETSALTMLDGTDGMSLRISKSIDSLYSHTAFESWESIQRLHGCSNSADEISSLVQSLGSSSPDKLPLIFVTTLHLRLSYIDELSTAGDSNGESKAKLEAQISDIKQTFRNGLQSHCSVAFFDSLDTANLIVIINSDSYSKVVDLLEQTLSRFPGMISNTHVGLLNDQTDRWANAVNHDKIDRCRIQVALKDTSSQKAFIDALSKKIVLPSGNKVYPYSNLGIYDIIFEFNGQPPLTSNTIIAGINAIRSESANAFYDFTVSIENKIVESTLLSSPSSVSSEPTSAHKINQEINKFIEKQKEKFSNEPAYISKPSYVTAIYLFDILSSISQKIMRACEEGHVAPLVPMMLSALKGFENLFENSNNDDSEYALISLSKFVTELYYVYRSSMYGVVEPQMLDGVSLFRDIPERLVEKYYSFIDSVSYFIRGEHSPDAKSNFFYLLVPGVSPSVKTERLFYSEDLNSRLLIIHFPRVMLFNAKILMPSLIHEIAHYSGDKERRRPERQNTIFDLVAYNILHQINMEVTNPSFMYMKQLLYRNYESKRARDLSVYSNNPIYNAKYDSSMLESLGPILRESIYRLFDQESMQSWATVAADAGNGTPEDYQQALCSALAQGLFGQMLIFINSLLDIFSEVYADIVAIQLLELSCEEYLNMLWQNGNDFSPKTSIQERIQIVTESCWDDDLANLLKVAPAWLEHDKFERMLCWRQGNNTNVYPNAIRQHIVGHFKDVIKDFRKDRDSYSKSVGELRHAYHSLFKSE